MVEGLVSIGRFARVCRLSVKQLRHYHDINLLRAAHVDADTGYRYYRVEQSGDALSIGLLRSMGVPLVAIAEVLAAADRRAALEPVRDSLERELARRQRTLQLLDGLLNEGPPGGEVAVEQRETTSVAAVHGSATPDTIGQTTGQCVDLLSNALAAAGVAISSPLIGVFPLDLRSDVAVTVAAETTAPPPKALRAVLRGGAFAATTHVGAYEHVSLAAHRVLRWIAERGHTPTSPILEIYLTDPSKTEPDQYITRVLIAMEDD